MIPANTVTRWYGSGWTPSSRPFSRQRHASNERRHPFPFMSPGSRLMTLSPLLFFLLLPILHAEVPAVPRSQEELVQPAVPGAGQIILTGEPEDYDLDFLNQRIPLFFEHYKAPDAVHPVRRWDIRFLSTDVDGSPILIHAQLFIPLIQAQAKPSLPLYVFASGTTGITDRAAPSLEKPDELRWGWYRENMLAYATLGHIVIFPDYSGFHDPQVAQRYFSKYAEGYMMLDAIRAVQNFFQSPDGQSQPVHPSGDVFTAGYSQGGHAAMAAADLRPLYAPEVPLSGMITYGSTNNIEALLREGVAYTPAILYSFREIYGHNSLDPADYLQPRFVPNFDQEAIESVDIFQVFYGFDSGRVYTPRFRNALLNRTLQQDFPALWVMGEENNSGLSGHGLPALVIQGSQDFIVTDASQTEFVLKLRALGSETRFLIYPEASHRYTRHAGFQASIDWMQQRAGRQDPWHPAGSNPGD